MMFRVTFEDSVEVVLAARSERNARTMAIASRGSEARPDGGPCIKLVECNELSRPAMVPHMPR